MKPKLPANCRDAKAVAAAWGVELYAQRLQKAAQLESIRTLMAHPAFPVKVKGLWPFAKVVQFGLEHVQVSKDKRQATLREKPVELVKPTVESGGGEADAVAALLTAEQEAILAKYPVPYQLRYRGLYAKWLNPNSAVDKALTSKEYDELVGIGLVKRGGLVNVGIGSNGKPAPVEVPDYCSQAQLAAILSEIYNVPVNPMQVSRAINEEGMPGRQKNQSVKTSLAIPWWEENKVRKVAEGQGTLFQQATAAELQRKIDEGRRAKMEADELERSTSDKWIRFAVVKGFFAGTAQQLAGAYDRMIEDRAGLRARVAEVLAAQGLTPELCQNVDAALAAEFPKAVDELKDTFAVLADELEQKLNTLRNKERE